jgi:hypothetical protein
MGKNQTKREYEKNLLFSSAWMDLEDIEEDIHRFFKCNTINCFVRGQCIYFGYKPEDTPTNRDIIGFIQYVIWDLKGMVVIDEKNDYVRVRIRVRTNPGHRLQGT